MRMIDERRPHNFKDIVGHKKTIDTFKHYSKEGNGFPRFIMLSGASGSGKSTSAKIIAQTLVCENPIKQRGGNFEPCNTCASCQDILSERYSRDVVKKVGSSVGKEEVKKIERDADLGAMYGSNKVIILEEAQEIVSSSAKSAFYDLLEKEREGVTFILVTMDDSVFSKALKDRCDIFKFKKLSVKEISKYLMEVLKEIDPEEDKYPDSFIEVVIAIASNAEGSMRNALQTFQRAIDSKIFTEEELIEELDITTESTLEAFITEVLKGNASALYTISKSDSLSNIFGKLLSMMITWKRNYMTNTFFNEGEQKKCEFFVGNKNFNSLLDTFVDISKDNTGYFNNNVFYYHILKFIDGVKEVKVIKEEVKPTTTSRRKLKEV